MFVHDEDFAGAHDVEVWTDTRVDALDLDNRRLVLPRNETLPFDALLLATGAMAACSPPAGDVAAVATDHVDMPKSYRFEPAAISIAPATTVTWTNSDNFTHTVRIDGEVIGQAEPGESITHDFA